MYKMKMDKSQRDVAQSAFFIFKLLLPPSWKTSVFREARIRLQGQPNDVRSSIRLAILYVVYVGILFNLRCHHRALSVTSRRKAPGEKRLLDGFLV